MIYQAMLRKNEKGIRKRREGGRERERRPNPFFYKRNFNEILFFWISSPNLKPANG